MKHVLTLLALFFLAACSSGGGDTPTPPDESEPPEASTLLFPENNSECEEGEPLSDNESSLRFEWGTAANADRYTLHVQDLEDESIQTSNTAQTSAVVNLKRGHPYAWWVTSRSDSNNETARSATWRFYNAGVAQSAHAPFPAAAVNPARGATVAAGPVTLEWQGNDVDEDLVSYTVFFGTEDPPANALGSQETTRLTVTANSGNTYYWQVISTDAAGNRTPSPVFSFRAQ